MLSLLRRDFERPFGEISVGRALRHRRGRTVTKPTSSRFAALTGDLHPQHTDADWSASSRFGERIAHGLLVLSFAAGLVPLDPDRIVALRGVRDAVFKRR